MNIAALLLTMTFLASVIIVCTFVANGRRRHSMLAVSPPAPSPAPTHDPMPYVVTSSTRGVLRRMASPAEAVEFAMKALADEPPGGSVWLYAPASDNRSIVGVEGRRP